MKKSNWRYRFLIWYAARVLRVPIIVNFTPEWMDELFILLLKVIKDHMTLH